MTQVVDTARDFRSALSEFATGITVVSFWHDGIPGGTTVNSFVSISLDPELVMVSLAKGKRTLKEIRANNFTVNVLPANAHDVATHFAGRPQPIAVKWELGGSSPRLAETVSWFSCEPWAVYDGGDHELVLGKVIDFGNDGGDPLIFHRGAMQNLV